MLANKDIIIRVVLGIIVLFMFVKVALPVFLEVIKKKIPGSYNPDNDIDSMIRRQKERLRAEYGLSGLPSKNQEVTLSEIPLAPASQEIETLYKESRWGGGEFSKRVQSEITKNYSYTLAESKVNAFVLLAEKRQYLRFLSADNQKSPEAIKNYLSMLMLFLILVDEIRNKEFNLLDRVAKKCQVTPQEFLIALQLKILFEIKSKKEIKEERLFVDSPVLHQFSEDTIKEALDSITKKESNFWARGHSFFFEELSLYLTYADILMPLPKVQHKRDIETAYLIMGTDAEMEMEEIKKLYKKMAMARHPDKIGQLKLPKILEKKAVMKFNQMQEAYEIITTHRKK